MAQAAEGERERRPAVPNDPKERQPWERQEGEPSRHYRRFLIYRNMGAERSVRKAAEVNKLCKKAQPGTWQSWTQIAYRWHWSARAAAYDAWQEDLTAKHESERVAELAIAEADARIEARQAELEAGRKAVQVGKAVVQRLIALVDAGELERLTLERVKASGVQYALACAACGFEKVISKRLRMCPSCQSPDIELEKRYSEVERRSVAQLLNGALLAIGEGQRIQRLALGEPTDITEQRMGEKAREIADIIRQHVPEERWEDVAAAIDNLLDGHVRETVAVE